MRGTNNIASHLDFQKSYCQDNLKVFQQLVEEVRELLSNAMNPKKVKLINPYLRPIFEK